MWSFQAVLWLNLRLQLTIVVKKQFKKERKKEEKKEKGLGSSEAISVQHPSKKGGTRKKQRATTSPEGENEATVAGV